MVTNLFQSVLLPVVKIAVLIIFAMLGVIYLCFDDPWGLIENFGHFFLLGLAGAIVANSTGAGGGVVFIPAFVSVGVAGTYALGTSLAIQCFGMTAGSYSWLRSIHRHEHGGREAVNLTYHLLIISGLSAIAGMLSAQYFGMPTSASIITVFKYFSIMFGLLLLVVTLKKSRNKHTLYHVRKRDIPLIIVVCFSGGIVTSWISIGAGEWLAILLFFLGYPTMVTVCVAVCVSSLVVLSGIPYHLFISDTIIWKILIFAAPAALIGGLLARHLAERLGPIRLKIFFAAWILATGLVM